MADNQTNDIKKINDSEIEKSRKIVLDYIKEKDRGKKSAAAEAVKKEIKPAVAPIAAEVKQTPPPLAPLPPEPFMPLKKPEIKKPAAGVIDLTVDFKKAAEKEEKKIPRPTLAVRPAEAKNKEELARKEARRRGEEKKRLALAKARVARTQKIKSLKNKFSHSASRPRRVFRYAVYFLAVLLSFALLAYIAFAFFLYGFSPDSDLTRTVDSYLPVPALITKFGPVDYYDYKDLKAELVITARNEGRPLLERELLAKAKAEAVKEKIVNKLAAKYGLGVSDDEIDAVFLRALILSFSGQGLEQTLKEMMGPYYNLSRERYLERVIKPRILAEKVSRLITRDETINGQGLEKIGWAKNLAERGNDLSWIADKYGYEIKGLEYFNQDQAMDKFNQIFVELEKGRRSGIIITEQGYYLVELLDRLNNLVSLKYIFVKTKPLDDYLSEQLRSTLVLSFVN